MEETIDILRVGSKGQGVGHDESGNIYFVDRTLPGDRVRVAFEPGSRRYRDATVVEFINKSKERVDSPCPYFQECGGCDYLDWSYPSQCNAKDQTVTHILSRQLVEARRRLPIRRAQNTMGYRTRVQMRSDGQRLGFYRRKTHEIVDIDRCVISHPLVNAEIGRLRAARGGETGKVEITMTRDSKIRVEWNLAHAASGFTQVNEEQNAYLKARVNTLLGASKRVLELFAGDGNLTFAYETGREVIAVDANRLAVNKASERARPGLSFLTDVVDRRLLSRLPTDFVSQSDALLIDPPRQGLGINIEHLLPRSVKRIVYVSCAPVELAKDALALKALGFEFVELECIDMFPQTKHIESLALFEKCLVN